MELVIFVISGLIAYLLIGEVVTGMGRRFNIVQDHEVEMTIVFWPIMLAMILFTFIAIVVAED